VNVCDLQFTIVAAFNLDHVDPELGLHRTYHFTPVFPSMRHSSNGFHHTAFAEPSEIAAAHCCARFLRKLLLQATQILALLCTCDEFFSLCNNF